MLLLAEGDSICSNIAVLLLPLDVPDLQIYLKEIDAYLLFAILYDVGNLHSSSF